MTARDDVPLELRDLCQWVVWRREVVGGRTAKRPYQPARPKLPARVNVPGDWGAYEQARDVVGFFDGLGLVLTATDPYCVLDLDNCLDDGEAHPEARALLARLGGYVEVSPSWRGLHAIIAARLAPGCRHKTATPWGWTLEAYDRGRFITIRGVGSGTPRPAQEALDALVARWLTPAPAPARTALSAPHSGSDAELLARMFTSRRGAALRRLHDGDDGEYGGDASRGDLAFCRALAFFTGQDAERIDRIFRASGRMRSKWDRPQSGSTYGALTIAKALR